MPKDLKCLKTSRPKTSRQILNQRDFAICISRPGWEMPTICLNVFTEHIVVLFCRESIPRIYSDF